MKSDNKTKKLSLASLFAAIIFLVTMLHITVGANGVYIHAGDAFVYLAASFLPLPYAAAAAAIGSACADIAGSAVVWAPFSAVIKSVMVLFFTGKKETAFCKRNAMAVFFALIANAALYYIAQILLSACGPIVPLASLPFDILQSVVSAVIYICLAVILDRSGVKQKLIK